MMPISLPQGAFVLQNLKVPASLLEGFPIRRVDPISGHAIVDIAVRNGRFQTPVASDRPWDADNRLLLPRFVDMHVHLDKAFTVSRTGFSDTGLSRAVELSIADAPNRTVDDLVRRMDQALHRAEAHGTAALRTHLDTFEEPDASAAWTAFAEIESAWKGKMTLQAVALMALFRVEGDDFDKRCAQIARRGGLLGAFIGPGAATAARLDLLLTAAQRHHLDLDLHVDETLDPGAEGLALLAEAALRHRFCGRIVAGHCCALTHKPEAEMDALIARVAEAGIHVVSLPLTNGFLQDRKPGRTPRLRGIAPVGELRAAGVNVAFASDNVRDAFYPYGDFDMLEVMRQAQFLGQLESDPAGWAAAAHANAARAMGLEQTGTIRAGGPADAILFEARDWANLFSGTAVARCVLREGRPLGFDASGANATDDLKRRHA
jgi:cytosine/creatinine deaminase